MLYRDKVRINENGMHFLEQKLEIRSAIFKLSTTGRYDDTAYFGGPLHLTIKTDTVRQGGIPVPDPRKWLCLAIADFELKSWNCASRIDLENSQAPLGSETMYYEAWGPGTYAVILRPRCVPVEKHNAFKGLITVHKPFVLGL